MSDAFEFSAQLLDGTAVPLDRYRGQVLLVVNTASKCGFTPQYAGLEALHRRYAERGFSVLAFPCNQFGGQEPGDSDAIQAFCAKKYQISFPIFEKVDVNGPKAHPLFTFLKQSRKGLLGSEAIKWNFTKFLVNRQGQAVKRFAPAASPESLAGAVEAEL